MSNAKVLVLELTDRRNSGFVKEGTQGTVYAEYLDAPNLYRLPNSSVEVQKDGSYKKLRFIAGASTIYFDEQVKANIQPNPTEDVIWFESGVKTVVRAGRDVALYDYLEKCEFNGSNKNKPETAQVKFRQIDIESDSEKMLENADKKMEAFQEVANLSFKTPKGWEYDQERIDFLCRLLGIGGLEGFAQKTLAIRAVAEQRPEYFLTTLGNKRSMIKAEIAHAVQFNVINITGDYASFSNGGLNILKFKQKDGPSRQDELADYLLSKKGELDYKNLTIELTAAREKQLALAD